MATWPSSQGPSRRRCAAPAHPTSRLCSVCCSLLLAACQPLHTHNHAHTRTLYTPSLAAQTVSTLSVARVLAIHRSDYESIADRFQDSARAVLENLLRYTQQARGEPARCLGLSRAEWRPGPLQRARSAAAFPCGSALLAVVSAANQHPQSKAGCPSIAPQITAEEFAGASGSAALQEVLDSEEAAKLQFGAPAAAAVHGCNGGSNGHGAGPLGRPSPFADDRGRTSLALLTHRQQQVVGRLMRVRALVSHFVAKHDEDRVMVGRACCSVLQVVQWRCCPATRLHDL